MTKEKIKTLLTENEESLNDYREMFEDGDGFDGADGMRLAISNTVMIIDLLKELSTK